MNLQMVYCCVASVLLSIDLSIVSIKKLAFRPCTRFGYPQHKYVGDKTICSHTDYFLIWTKKLVGVANIVRFPHAATRTFAQKDQIFLVLWFRILTRGLFWHEIVHGTHWRTIFQIKWTIFSTCFVLIPRLNSDHCLWRADPVTSFISCSSVLSGNVHHNCQIEYIMNNGHAECNTKRCYNCWRENKC